MGEIKLQFATDARRYRSLRRRKWPEFQSLLNPLAAPVLLQLCSSPMANVLKIPGLNTLGVSLARIDYAPGGLNPPLTYPCATEIAFVVEGELDVAFITTANVLISKSIKKGEIFVFPKGLVHFQKNNSKVPAAVLVAFNSQLPVPSHCLLLKSWFAPKK